MGRARYIAQLFQRPFLKYEEITLIQAPKDTTQEQEIDDKGAVRQSVGLKIFATLVSKTFATWIHVPCKG